LIDNTSISFTCLEAEKGVILYQQQTPPSWVENFIGSLHVKPPVSAKSLASIEDVRKLYATKSQKEGKDKTFE